MNNTDLTTEQLSDRIKYDPRTIRQCLKDSVLLEGKHYIRSFGGRKFLCIWEIIKKDMLTGARSNLVIPMANGAVCHG